MTGVAESAVSREVRNLRERHSVVQRMQAWLDEAQRQSEYDVEVLGEVFRVQPGVFSPRFYPETEFYAQHVLHEMTDGVRFLDMGCGIGVNAVMAAKRGAQVVACDISAAAVENTRRNARLHDVEVSARESDVFSAIASDERFDVIYWNIPFAFRQPTVRLPLIEEAIFDPGFRKHVTFLTQAGRYLEPGGLVLAGVSSTLGELSTIRSIAEEARLSLEFRASTLEEGTEHPVHLELLAARTIA